MRTVRTTMATSDRRASWGRILMASDEQQHIERLASGMYQETFARLDDPRLCEVVQHKVTALYGPPMVRPDLALISFQGGAGDRSPSARTWPRRLVYLDDDFCFGRTLRRQCALAGLDETLERRTVAMAACFPEAPSAEAGPWMGRSGAIADWRAFSVAWVRKMVAAMSPRVVVVFGTKASRAMEMEAVWRDEHRDARNWRTFGRAEVVDCAAIYCQHLSQGWTQEHVQRSFREAASLIRT